MNTSGEDNAPHTDELALQTLMAQIRQQVAEYSDGLLQALNQTCESMEARHQVLNHQVDQLSQALTDSRAELEQQRDQSLQHHQQHEQLLKQQDALKQLAEKEHAELHELRGTCGKQAQQLEGQQQRIHTLESQLAESLNSQKQAVAALEQEADKNQSVKQQLKDAEGRAESFAAKIARYAESEQHHVERLEKAAAEYQTLKRQLDYAECRIDELDAEIKTLQGANHRLKAAHQQLTGEMEQTCNRAEELNSAFRRCKIELEKRDDELAILQQRLEQVLINDKV